MEQAIYTDAHGWEHTTTPAPTGTAWADVITDESGYKVLNRIVSTPAAE